jgi:hypothetical protein
MMLASMAKREQFRTLQRAKVRISEHKTKGIILRRRLYSKEPGAIGGGLKGHENVHMKKFSYHTSARKC